MPTSATPAATAAPDERGSARLFRELRSRLRPADPTPLFHQLANALRWEIGMGRLSVGDALPTIHQLADAVGVHYHTARRAYRHLAADGVLVSRRGAGTRLARSTRPVASAGTRESPHAPLIVECNLTQAAQLARQVQQRFGVAAVAHVIDALPPHSTGPVLTTSFHAAAVADRLAGSTARLHALPVVADPGSIDAVVARMDRLGLKRLVVVERDVGTGESLAEEIRARLGRRAAAAVIAPARLDVAALAADRLFLLSPRVWDEMPDAVQDLPNVMTMRFHFTDVDLDAVAAAHGWQRVRLAGVEVVQ